MITTRRTWNLWASRHESGKLWHTGTQFFVKLHGSQHPIVPVCVEEILGDPYAPEVTHYDWQYAEGSSHRRDAPTMIYIRTGETPARAMLFLDMCFPSGLAGAIKKGDGAVVALRITERPEHAP